MEWEGRRSREGSTQSLGGERDRFAAGAADREGGGEGGRISPVAGLGRGGRALCVKKRGGRTKERSVCGHLWRSEVALSYFMSALAEEEEERGEGGADDVRVFCRCRGTGFVVKRRRKS